VRRRNLHDRFAVRQEEEKTGLPREKPNGGIGLASIFLEGERRPAELRIETHVPGRGGTRRSEGTERDGAAENNDCGQKQGSASSHDALPFVSSLCRGDGRIDAFRRRKLVEPQLSYCRGAIFRGSGGSTARTHGRGSVGQDTVAIFATKASSWAPPAR
jgi:hypothetical protein